MSLSTRDVALLLGTTASGVHKLVQRGRLKTLRSGRGNAVRYDSMSVAREMSRRDENPRKA